MRDLTVLFGEFKNIAENPRARYEKLLAEGKKIVGLMPYFCPEELVIAAGMTPFGLWGADIEATESKRYFPAFICSILHTILELGIKGAYKGMSAVMIPKQCDSLKCMGANWEFAKTGIPVINVAQAQNRKMDAGVEFTASQYREISAELSRLGGKAVSDGDISAAIKLLNRRRAAMREFVKLASEHPDAVTPKKRNDVLKSAYFMEAAPYTALLGEMNEALRALPPATLTGPRVVTTGIIADSPALLGIFEDNNISIAADQVAHESVSFGEDVSESGEPYTALARRMADIEGTSVLYDPGKRRAKELLKLVKETGADGAVFILTKFCDPEEYDYVPVKQLLSENSVPVLLVEIDRQSAGYEQARSAVEAFCGILGK